MRRGPRLYLMIAGPVVVALVALYFYLTGGRYQSTDDAYVQAAQTMISTDISGRVVDVDVHDNQRVHKGEVLFHLNNRPYRIAAQVAQAKLASAKADVEALKALYQQKQSELRAAEDSLKYAGQEYARQKRLLKPGITSRSRYEQALNARDAAQQKVAAVKQEAAGVLARLGGKSDIASDQVPAVQEATANLLHAQLNLSYTIVKAPAEGIVTKVEQLQVGDYVTTGTPLFALISATDVWVEANFKEVQLTQMRVGQTATVNVDAYPDRSFKAHVAAFSPGTGAQFSSLPPENATGNWVKVVQRLPVRLQFDNLDPSFPLYAGLSTTVEVDTKGSTQSTNHPAQAAPTAH